MPIQEWSDAIWVVSLSDEPELADDLMSLLARSRTVDPMHHLVLDLSGLTGINSSNLTRLLLIHRVARERDATLTLAAMPARLWPVFRDTGLSKLFDFVADVPSALTRLQMQTAACATAN